MEKSSRDKPGYLFVLPWDVEAIGGVNQVVLSLYDKMSIDTQYNPIIMVNHWRTLKPVVKYVDNRAVVKLRLRSPYSKDRTFLRFVLFWLLLPHTAIVLSKFLRDQKIEIINPHYPELPLYIFHVLRKFHIFKGKIIISLHGSDVRLLKGIKGLSKYLWIKLLRGCDRIVTCSRALQNEAKSILEIKEDKFSVIHNGVDPTFSIPNINNNESAPQEQLVSWKYILNVATYEHKKGQDVLIKAFSKLDREFSGFKLVLIGRRTKYLDILQSLAIELNCKDQIVFYENIPHGDLGPFFQYAHFFILPSRIEPFGIVLLEAGLYKLPVIASNVGGVGEIIKDGVNGRLVQPDNPAELHSRMEEYCLKPKQISALGSNLYQDVQNNFLWESAYQQYCELCA